MDKWESILLHSTTEGSWVVDQREILRVPVSGSSNWRFSKVCQQFGFYPSWDPKRGPSIPASRHRLYGIPSVFQCRSRFKTSDLVEVQWTTLIRHPKTLSVPLSKLMYEYGVMGSGIYINSILWNIFLWVEGRFCLGNGFRFSFWNATGPGMSTGVVISSILIIL
jgi:hypothetical protein